jgi:anti-sigma regulatory factor (Ser/Thr protein kinase)
MSAGAPTRPSGDTPNSTRSQTSPGARASTMTLRAGLPLEVRLPASVQAVPTARHKVARWLSHARVDSEVRDELALVVTELVTNAVEASPGPSASIEIQVRFGAGPAIILQVADEGSGFDLSQQPALPTERAVRGRGLPIVHALMDELTVERRGDHTVVEVSRALRNNDR